MWVKPKFQIGDSVFHVLPESPAGIITNIIYQFNSWILTYEVMFDPEGDAVKYGGFELYTGRKVI